jgi:hypothetical protein
LSAQLRKADAYMDEANQLKIKFSVLMKQNADAFVRLQVCEAQQAHGPANNGSLPCARQVTVEELWGGSARAGQSSGEAAFSE